VVVCLKDENLADAATLSSEAQEMEEMSSMVQQRLEKSFDGEHNRKWLYEERMKLPKTWRDSYIHELRIFRGEMTR
jgi:hypothetical protein